MVKAVVHPEVIYHQNQGGDEEPVQLRIMGKDQQGLLWLSNGISGIPLIDLENESAPIGHPYAVLLAE
jgi:hypothetical protein